jgi:hypothetical protein
MKHDQLLIPGQSCNSDNDLDKNPRLTLTRHPVIYKNNCPCDTHYDKQLLEQTYDLTVDKLFDLLFGKNEFVQTYRQAQRIYGLCY